MGFYDSDEEFHNYMVQWVRDGLDEGEAFFREMIEPMMVRGDEMSRATMEQIEDLADTDPEGLRRLLTNETGT